MGITMSPGRCIQSLRDNFVDLPRIGYGPVGATYEYNAVREWYLQKGLRELCKVSTEMGVFDVGLHSDLYNLGPSLLRSLMSFEDTVRHYGTPEKTFRNWLAEGKGPRSVKFGRERWFYTLEVNNLWYPTGYEENSRPLEPPHWEDVLKQYDYVRLGRPLPKTKFRCIDAIHCGSCIDGSNPCSISHDRWLHQLSERDDVKNYHWVELAVPLARKLGSFGERALLERFKGDQVIAAMEAAFRSPLRGDKNFRIIGQPSSMILPNYKHEIIGFYALVRTENVEKVHSIAYSATRSIDRRMVYEDFANPHVSVVPRQSLKNALSNLSIDPYVTININGNPSKHISSRGRTENYRGDRLPFSQRFISSVGHLGHCDG